MRLMRGFAIAMGALCTLIATHSVAGSPLAAARAAQAREHILGLDLDDARRDLEGAEGADSLVAREQGRLALYEADCDRAVTTLAALAAQKDEEADALLEIARGCARVTAATVADTDDARGVLVRYQDEADRALTPLIVDTVARARDALTKDLGVTWPRPTRIVVVRDLLSLSAMTGLPYESAQTTGTVAVAKWGRVTLLSPRASQHGYGWRDTVAHELTHLAVTRLTADRAPLWLQEGMAKREEVRWREPGPFDDRPSPDAIARRGIDKKLDLPLDRLGPSIAMLPSAAAATVAFAEVTSFVRFYAKAAGDEGVRRLLSRLREGDTVDAALSAASGANLATWDARWRAEMAARRSEPVSMLDSDGRDGKARAAARDKVRLAELLLGRDHATAAAVELGHVGPGLFERDASYAYVAGRVDERARELAVARAHVGDPMRVDDSYGPYWALRGRLASLANEPVTARASFDEAIAQDPLSEQAACGTLDREAPARDATLSALCAAARARNEPDIGRN